MLCLILEALDGLYPLSVPVEMMKVNTRCTWQLWPLRGGTGICRCQNSLLAPHTTPSRSFSGSLELTGIPHMLIFQLPQEGKFYWQISQSAIFPSNSHHANQYDANLSCVSSWDSLALHTANPTLRLFPCTQTWCKYAHEADLDHLTLKSNASTEFCKAINLSTNPINCFFAASFWSHLIPQRILHWLCSVIQWEGLHTFPE